MTAFSVMANQVIALVSFEHDLPPELREMVYERVADLDEPHIASKPLPGRTIYCSYLMRSFSSTITQAEYRAVFAKRMPRCQDDVVAVVKDFNFNQVSKFLQERDKAGTLGGLQVGGGQCLEVILVFSKDFDGLRDRALKWTRTTQRLAKKHGKSLNSDYSVREAMGSRGLRNFKESLIFDTEDLGEESEWARILQGLQKSFAPEFDTPPGSPDGYSIGTESFDSNGDWIDDADRASRRSSEPGGPPDVQPADDLEQWGGDTWAEELLGGKIFERYSRR